MKKDYKILITGVAGFIGYHLANKFNTVKNTKLITIVLFNLSLNKNNIINPSKNNNNGILLPDTKIAIPKMFIISIVAM